jgi:MFS transporter, DHA2 family, glioxin efflux transporter
MMLGGTFVTAGSGLLFALHVNSGIGEWSGCQVVAAFGFGLGIQIPYVVVQNVPSAEDVATGSALIIFSQNFAGAVAITIAQNIVSLNLQEQLREIPGVNAVELIAAGGTEIREKVNVFCYRGC